MPPFRGVAMLASPDETFIAEVTHDGMRAIVRVRGEIDLANAAAFHAVLDCACGECTGLDLDMREVTFLDSSGLAVLMAVYRRLGEAREAVVVHDPGPAALRALEISGVADLLDIRCNGSS